MTRKSSIITTVGAALVLALPATALGQNERFAEAPQWHQALMARSEGLNKQHGLGDYSPAIRALHVRSDALNRQYGLGEYASSNVDMINARERSFETKADVVPSSPIDVRERSFAAKREAQLTDVSGPDAFERAVVASTRETPPIVADDRFRLDPTTGGEPTPVSVTSGREIEWPQVGIGLGIGALLMIGLYLALKGTRQRPLAH